MFACCILYSRHHALLYYFTFQVWSLNTVQLILELLVAGTPTSSITAAIVDFVQNIATYIVIKELPSIWFIHQFRTVLLIICQLLSRYRLSKSDKWGNFQKYGTVRQQTEMINVIITIPQENNPILLPVIFYVSIIPEDKTEVGQHDTIVLFIKE